MVVLKTNTFRRPGGGTIAATVACTQWEVVAGGGRTRARAPATTIGQLIKIGTALIALIPETLGMITPRDAGEGR